MSKDYFIVHKELLPDYLDQVLYARTLLENHEVSSVTEAVQKAGISRSTYYKYKDYVFEENQDTLTRHATLSIILKDEKGALSSLIALLTKKNTSILTISQSLPVAKKANVLITIDITSMKGTMDELTAALKQLDTVRAVHLDAIE